MKLNVSHNNAMKLLADSFSSHATFLTELLQNARRAGATRIVITYDQKEAKLIVADNGCGITDFSKLLTLCESGWGSDVQESDAPYGVGFLSAIMASKEFSVFSGGKILRANVDELLAGGSASIEDDAPQGQPGTLIVLKLRKADMEIPQMISKAAVGFPVNVVFNGVEVSRPFALDCVKYKHEIEGIGTLVWDGEIGTYLSDPTMLLQGLPIKAGQYSAASSNYGRSNWTIHLDQSKFRGRMPDREQVIDMDYFRELGVREHINAAQKSLFAKVFESFNGAPPLMYYRVASHEELHTLIESVTSIPAGVFQRIDDRADIERLRLEYEDKPFDVFNEHVTKDDLSRLLLIDLPSGTDESDDIPFLRVLQSVTDKQVIDLFSNLRLPEWARQFRRGDLEVTAVALKKLDDGSFEEVENPVIHRVECYSKVFDVVICDAVKVMLVDDDRNEVFSKIEDDYCPTVEGTLFITGGQPVVCDYFFQQDAYDYMLEDREDEWDWDRIAKERHEFLQELNLALGADPIALVRDTLAKLKYHKKLEGRSYEVVFDGSRIEVKELKEAA